MFEVRYENRADDFREAICAIPWRLRMRWRGWYWAIMIASALPGTLLLAALGRWSDLAFSWAVWGALASFFRYRMWAAQRKALRASLRRLKPTTFRMTPERLEVTTDRGRIRSAWRAIDQAFVTRKQLILVTTALTFHVIPRRAFASVAEADAFFQAARQYHHHAMRSEAPSLVPAAAVPADDDSLQIHYQNTPAEFVSVLFDGVRSAAQPARKPATSRSGLVFLAMGLGLALILLNLRDNGNVTPFFPLCVFLIITSGLLVLLQPLSRRLTRTIYIRRCAGPCSVTVSPEGVAAVDLDNDYFVAWSEFSGIEEDDRFVVFFQNDRTHVSLLVPKQAFANPDQAARFAALADRHWRQAQPEPPPELTAAADTGNPYQSPAAR